VQTSAKAADYENLLLLNKGLIKPSVGAYSTAPLWY